MDPRRVIIVDDEELQLQRMKIILDGENDFSVVGAFNDGEQALAFLGDHEADLLLTDLQMPGIHGLTLIKKANELYHHLTIIALTAMDDVETVVQALRDGAVGYLLKTDSSTKLCDGLRETLNEGASLSPSVARSLIGQFQNGDAPPTVSLSKREKDILADATDGVTYKETADRLGLSVHTVHHHARNIFEKLDVHNKAEALQVAKKRGLI